MLFIYKMISEFKFKHYFNGADSSIKQYFKVSLVVGNCLILLEDNYVRRWIIDDWNGRNTIWNGGSPANDTQSEASHHFEINENF